MRARLAWALSLAGALVLGAFAYAQAPASTVISDIRQESADDSTRLVVVSNGPLTYTYYSPDPLTLIVDVPDVDVSAVPARLSVGTQEVESLRVTPMTRGEGRSLARLEVRMARRSPYSIYSKDNALNLVFERTPASVQTAAVAPSSSNAPVEEKQPARDVVDAPVAEAAADRPLTAEPPASTDSSGTVRHVAKASRILGVTQQAEGGKLAVSVRADGRLRYQDFFLGNPDRLVVDFRDVSSGPQRSIEVNAEPLRRIRLAQFSAASPKVARLVVELTRRSPYRVVEATDGLKLVFGEGDTPSPAPLAALRAEPEPELAAVPALLAGPGNLDAAPMLAVPVAVAEPEPQAMRPESFEMKTVVSAEKKYTGHPISLDFKDGDLQDIFRLFADISGLNVVINPGVGGKVTLKLTEVPWDQALDLILKTNGLGYSLEDNVIRIARNTDLKKEEQERRALQEEKALAGDLAVIRKPLSYAKAGELEPTVKKVALSSRGNITLDTRTNTMIITDLPVNIGKAEDLIRDLDRATPQVEIEARIVVTSRSFSRNVGIQWGFLQQNTPQYGNTFQRSFPNSMVLNGGAVPGGGADQRGLATTAGIGQTGRGYAVNLPAAQVNSALGISLGNILGSFNLDAALTAAENHGQARILSTPKVTTQNNQPADIKQGSQIGYQTFSAQQGATIAFKDVVLTLKVTPQITEAGTVILGLEIENNSIAGYTPSTPNGGGGIPILNIQSVKTQVLVQDGATTVIGGIYQSADSTSQSRTPLLGDVPLLGYLFRNKDKRLENSELLVFITPRIIKS